MKVFYPSGKLAFEIAPLVALHRICPEAILYASAEELHLPDCATCTMSVCIQPQKGDDHGRLASGAAFIRRGGVLCRNDRVR